MKRATLLLLALVWLSAGPCPAARADASTVLQGPSSVDGLRRADANGDGRTDLLLLQGRKVYVWLGRAAGLPPATADHVFTLPDSVSFVDAGPLALGPPGLKLLMYGTEGMEILTQAGPRLPIAGAEPLVWRDAEKATFASLIQTQGLLVPRQGGWRFLPATGSAVDLDAPVYHSVTRPGPFLEDRLTLVSARPSVMIGRSPRASPTPLGMALWTIVGTQLRAGESERATSYDLAFLPPGGDTRLADLDGDGRPELMHRITTNRSGRYGFFKAREATQDLGPSLRPAVSDLDLSGFQLDPELVDLDADGLLDLVVTTIAVDMPNTLRAVTSGKVSARTRAFLNGMQKKGTFFGGEPDAEIGSEISVKARFTYAGTIEVQRHLTLVVDGDYDGDGRRDLLIRLDGETLAIHLGRPAGVWDPQPLRVAIPALGTRPDVEAYALNLVGDRRDELLLVYRGGLGKPDEVRIFTPLP